MTSYQARTHVMAVIAAVALSLTALAGTTVALSEPAGAAGLPAQPGSYTAPSPQYGSDPITFYVSTNGTQVQDVAIRTVGLTCTPGGGAFYQPFGIAAVAIKANGAFGSTTTQQGVYAGYPATITYTFQGNFNGTTVNGSFRETVTYTDSAKRTCTSNDQSFKATRDSQPSQAPLPLRIGSYTAPSPQYGSDPITFYVSADRSRMQDISIRTVGLTCAPGGGAFYQPFGIPAVAIQSNGSFSGTTTQRGVYAGRPATFTYTFRGNFHATDNNGVARVAGSFRENVTYADSATRTCTSNNQSWTATRDAQPAQTPGQPPAGSYSAPSPQYGSDPITFSVSANGTKMQNVAIRVVGVTCSPGGGSSYQPFGITAIAINASGAFSTTTTQHGTYAGRPATFTYTFQGNFHAVDNNGVARAAGSFRETVTYTDSATRTCTSNNQSWTALRTES